MTLVFYDYLLIFVVSCVSSLITCWLFFWMTLRGYEKACVQRAARSDLNVWQAYNSYVADNSGIAASTLAKELDNEI